LTALTLSRDDQLALVAEAARAPSAHNAQPARWSFLPAGSVTLFEDPATRLPVADPRGKDAMTGLGAAFEGMCIALSARGLGLSEPAMRDTDVRESETPAADDPVEIAGARLRTVSAVDPLAAVVGSRRTWRGRFDKATEEAELRLRECAEAITGATAIVDSGEVADLASLHDSAAWRFLRRPEYQAELYGWMRFTDRDPHWSRDGLTADCMGLSASVGSAARILFRPRWFAVLKTVGLARPILAERAAVRSATGLVILGCGRKHDWFQGGRELYRFWLELTRSGLSACPMSALVDDPESEKQLRERYGIADDMWIVNVLRVGPAPRQPVPLSPRLPANELLLDSNLRR
jgi:nitroreductase